MSYTYNLKEAIKLFIEAPAVAGVTYLFTSMLNGIYQGISNVVEPVIFSQPAYPIIASVFTFAIIVIFGIDKVLIDKEQDKEQDKE